MTQDTLNLGGTQAAIGARLERIVFGWIGYAAALLLLSPFLWTAISGGGIGDLLVAVLILGCLFHVLWHFIHDALLADAHRDVADVDVRSLLSGAVLRQIQNLRTVGAGDLFEAAATTDRGIFILQEMGIEPKELIEHCKKDVENDIELFPFLQYAVRLLPEYEERAIDSNIILLLLFKHVPACQSILKKADLSEEDLKGIVRSESFHHRFRMHASSLDPSVIRGAGSLGRSWVMGFTDALDWLTEEVSSQAPVSGEKSVVIHRESIQAILQVLARSNLRNILVLGKVGSGKRTLVRNVAWALRDLERKAHMPFTRVLVLKTQQLLSGVQQPDRFLLEAFTRAEHSGHFLLVIEDLAMFLKSASSQLQGVLLKFLQAKTISIVGIADTQDYHSLVKTDSSLDSMFEKVTVEDAGDDETMQVLTARSFTIAYQKGIHVTYKALKSIVELSKRYLGARGGFPGRAIGVLDDAVLRVQQSGGHFLREEHVRDVISVQSRVNVQKVTTDEKDRLLKLEDVMKEKIIGQDWAVKAVAGALKRARLDIHDRHKPVGTFLFIGPTGVGKTQTAKVLAEEYFGSAQALIRLDMNEFSHENSVFGIIGSPNGTGGSAEGFLPRRIQENPFSLILLDEVEKAHPKVMNVFLQILDEGMLTDARGMKTDFRSSIIIATSNAGALFIRDYVKEHPDPVRENFKSALLEAILREKIFTPEFVNRFDDTVLFMPLSRENAVKVGGLMLSDVITDVERKRGVTVKIDEALVTALVERGYSSEFGAREMRRTITDIIEDYLADYFLKNDVHRGDGIVIRKEDLKF